MLSGQISLLGATFSFTEELITYHVSALASHSLPVIRFLTADGDGRASFCIGQGNRGLRSLNQLSPLFGRLCHDPEDWYVACISSVINESYVAFLCLKLILEHSRFFDSVDCIDAMNPTDSSFKIVRTVGISLIFVLTEIISSTQLMTVLAVHSSTQ
jgi:hypothetical protein